MFEVPTNISNIHFYPSIINLILSKLEFKKCSVNNFLRFFIVTLVICRYNRYIFYLLL